MLARRHRERRQRHAKLRELLRKDLFDFGTAGADLQGYDACFFCLGVSSAGGRGHRRQGARQGAPKRVLEPRDLRALGANVAGRRL